MIINALFIFYSYICTLLVILVIMQVQRSEKVTIVSGNSIAYRTMQSLIETRQ